MRTRPASIAAALAAAACAPVAEEPALFDDFETQAGFLSGSAFADDHRVAVVEGEGVGGGRALRVEYVGGPMGSERIVRAFRLPAPGPEYTLSYDVRFAHGFQFTLGGKLHGLGPRWPVSGGQAVRPEGWSARVMWREAGRAETYIYHQDQAGRYGEAGDQPRAFAFEPGRYYAVSLHVRVNDAPDRANGFVRLYIDGELADARENLRLRATDGPDGLISLFLFSTFHGGNDADWAPRAADGGFASVYANFDNVAVHAGEAAPSIGD